eukprot:3073173-Prymnesium_polylepis.1
MRRSRCAPVQKRRVRRAWWAAAAPAAARLCKYARHAPSWEQQAALRALRRTAPSARTPCRVLGAHPGANPVRVLARDAPALAAPVAAHPQAAVTWEGVGRAGQMTAGRRMRAVARQPRDEPHRLASRARAARAPAGIIIAQWRLALVKVAVGRGTTQRARSPRTSVAPSRSTRPGDAGVTGAARRWRAVYARSCSRSARARCSSCWCAAFASAVRHRPSRLPLVASAGCRSASPCTRRPSRPSQQPASPEASLAWLPVRTLAQHADPPPRADLPPTASLPPRGARARCPPFASPGAGAARVPPAARLRFESLPALPCALSTKAGAL